MSDFCPNCNGKGLVRYSSGNLDTCLPCRGRGHTRIEEEHERTVTLEVWHRQAKEAGEARNTPAAKIAAPSPPQQQTGEHTIVLDAAAYAKFIEILDNPAPPSQELIDLMKAQLPWQQTGDRGLGARRQRPRER